jgi:hypothetical protein
MNGRHPMVKLIAPTNNTTSATTAQSKILPSFFNFAPLYAFGDLLCRMKNKIWLGIQGPEN